MKPFASALLALSLLLPGLGHAQGWPVKPVRMVVSTGAGQSSDAIARLLADRLSRTLGQQFVVENMPGAAGNIGAHYVVRAAADGYTLLFTGGGTLVTNAYAFKTMPFDPARDLAPIALVTKASGFLLAVTASLPVNSLAELVALAKAQPGKLSYAADVSNIYSQLAGRMLNREAGMDIVEIPYKGPPVALQDTISGRTQVMIGSATTLQTSLKGGKLRLIAVTASRRNPFFPDTPTLVESYPALNMDAVGFTVAGPAATPKDIVQRLNGAIVSILAEPKFIELLAAQGLGPADPGSPEQAAALLRDQRQRWGKIFSDLGIQPQ